MIYSRSLKKPDRENGLAFLFHAGFRKYCCNGVEWPPVLYAVSIKYSGKPDKSYQMR